MDNDRLKDESSLVLQYGNTRSRMSRKYAKSDVIWKSTMYDITDRIYLLLSSSIHMYIDESKELLAKMQTKGNEPCQLLASKENEMSTS